jgi:uncharacterized membrane protein
MLLALLLIVLLASALRFFQLEDDGLWLDEIFTHYDATKLPIGRLIIGGQLVSNFNHPPLYFLLARLAWSISPTDAALRAPAAMAGILCIPAIALFAARLFRRTEGLVAALLFTVSPVAIYYSQEARSYTMLWLFSLLSAWAFWKALESNDARLWAGVLLANAIGLYTSYLQILIVFVELAFLAIWLMSRLPTQAKARLFSFAATLLLLGLFAGVAHLPVADFTSQVGTEGGSSVHDKIFLEALPSAQNAFGWIHLYGNRFVSILFVALMAMGIIGSARAGRGWQALYLLMLMLVPIALIIMSNPPYTQIYPRYFTVALVFYLTLVARGIVVLHSLVLSWLRRAARNAGRGTQLSALLWMGMLGAILVPHVPALQSYYADVPGYFRLRPEWKEAVRVIQRDGGTSPLIVTVDAETELSFNRYMLTQRVDSLEALQEVIAQGQQGYLVYDSWRTPPSWVPDGSIQVVEGLEEAARFPQVIVYRFNGSAPP